MGGNFFQFLNKHNFRSSTAGSFEGMSSLRITYTKHESSRVLGSNILFFISLFNSLYKNTYCLQGLDWKVDILNNCHRVVIRNENNNKTKYETVLVKIL